MSRWALFIFLIVLGAIGAIVAGTVYFVRHDREAQLARLGEDQERRVAQAVRMIDTDLDEIRADLLFAGQIVEAQEDPAERTRELAAALGINEPYRVLRVYDGSGGLVLEVVNPTQATGGDHAGHDVEMADTARRALGLAPGTIVATLPLGRAGGGWWRVFATALPLGPRGAHAVAMLVDTEPLLGKLRLVAAGPESRLLVLGVHGQPLPASDEHLADSTRSLDERRRDLPAFATLVERMRAGQTGVVRIDADEANRLGLGSSDLVVAYAATQRAGEGHWSVATITSTASLRAHVRVLVVRLGLAAGAIVLCLLFLGVYVVFAARRAVVLRERLRHADHVAHLREKAEKILDHVPAGVMVFDEGGRVAALNGALRERLPGVAPGATLNEAFRDAPVAVRRRLEELLDGAREKGRVRSLLGERIALFGQEGQYNVHAVPLERRFPDARELLVVEDLTHVRSLESQLVRAEKLATVGVLAAGIAHEVGTPLGVVRGRAEYVLGKIGKEHPQADSVTVIVDQIDHVTRTIRQLLDFSRVKPAQVHAVDAAPIAAAVRELLRFEAERRKVALVVDVAPSLPPLAADPDELQQVLVNLVMNACDACAPGGQVTIAGVLDESGGAWRGVRLEVIDDGCGIPEANVAQVFDPFFTTKKRGQGTGLGLTIAAQIVRNHGGQIELESTAETGTRVRILWPIAAAVPASQEQRDVAG